MALQFFNTLTRKKELFKPLQEGIVHMYNCGPTVYDYAHIGNFRAFVCSDILKRYLQYKGYKVLQVMNITDVEDKIIKRCNKEKISLQALTKKYTEAFFEDLDTLHICRADHYPQATEHISEMIALIETLLKKEIAYKTPDGIYFDIRKFAGYGKLSHIKLEEMQQGTRVAADQYEKEHAQDFALWKFWDPKDGNIVWDAPFGKGRPGWHIECSAMSMKYLGKQFDIHTGGIDLIFPHHENEIAQSEAALEKHPFVYYWLHNDYILVEGKKMSKSLGNFYTLRDLLAKGYKPLAIRYLLLSSHYHQQLNFTFEALEAATHAVQRYQEFYDRMKRVQEEKAKNTDVDVFIADAQTAFEDALDNDLETAGALASVFEFIHAINKVVDEKGIGKLDAEKILVFFDAIDTVFALREEKEAIPADILYLAQQREAARKAKDWKKADEMRQELQKKGYWADDTKDGFAVKKL